MSTETLRVTRLPKSKMQTVRQFTNLRAFVEIGPDGQPIGYYIEQQGETPKPAKRGGHTRRDNVPKLAILVLDTDEDNPYKQGSQAQKSFDVAMDVLPCSRGYLEENLCDRLGLSAKQAASQVSYMIFAQPVLAVDWSAGTSDD